MANPHRGTVDLKAGDTTYTLSLSVNAICELEEALDMPVAKIGELFSDESGLRMKTVRTLVWAALLDHHSVDEKVAGEIASEAGISQIVMKIGEAMRLAFPEATAKAKANPRLAAKTNG